MSITPATAPLPLTDITIRSLGGLGDGIVDYEGSPLFVAKACAGDKLRVRISRRSAQEFTGEIVEILEPGPDRQDAPCPHYSECGSCSLQHLKPAAYQQFKRDRLASALRQSGYGEQQAGITFLEPATRRRADFSLTWQGGKLALSYYKLGSHTPTPISQCLILEPELQAFLPKLPPALAALPFIRQCKAVSITAADNGIDAVITMQERKPEYDKALAAMAASVGLARLSVSVRAGEFYIVHEPAPIAIRADGLEIAVPPEAFLQATREGQAMMIAFIQDAIKGAKTVADLFCGVGTYSFPASRSAFVSAFESDRTMTMQMRHNIDQLGLAKKVNIARRDLFKTPLVPSEMNRFDAVILNPPRTGAKNQCQQLAVSKVKTVVMVSCNPATWARDAKILKDAGYSLTKVQGIDQFVWNPHFEIVSLFTR